MLKAPNLLDLFANTRKDVQARAAQSKTAADGKNQAGGNKGAANLLPIDSNGNAKEGKGAASTPDSFHSKVKESRARLAAKTQKQAAARQDNGSEAAADRAAAEKANATRAAARSSNHQVRSDSNRPEHADRPEAAKPQARKSSKAPEAGAEKPAMKPQDDAQAAKAPVQESAPKEPTAIKDPSAGGPVEETGSVSDAELQSSLEAIGIYASEEQLQDPNVLADILAMIQSLSAQQTSQIAAVETQAQTLEEGAIRPVSADGEEEAEMPAMVQDETAGEGQTAAPQADPKAAAEAEAVELLQNRIAELTRNANDTQSRIDRAASSPVTTPAGWQGVEVRQQAESVSTSPLPMADLDRLRVMQASMLQASAGGKESEISSVELPGDEGTVDATAESDILHGIASEHNSAGGEDNQAQANHFGRNGDTARNAETSAPKEGSLVAKDGATGPLFHNSLDQARSANHRAAAAHRTWEPRPAFEAGVMDQIAKKLSSGGLKNGDEMSIQLSPEHLGKVRVSLEMKDGAMAARISVENDGVRLQVEAGLAALRDSLENQGIKLQGLEVSVDQRQSSLFNPDGSSSESFFHRNGRGAQGAGAAQETAPFESAPESDTGRRLGYNTMEYIG